MFFTADDGQHGVELWATDGTRNGTAILRDIADGQQSAFPSDLTASGGRLYFSADDGETGAELWVSDGTETGTQPVADIVGGPEGSFPAFLTDVDGTLFFSARDGEHGRELWKSDGTTAGTVLVKDVATVNDSYYSGPSNLLAVGGDESRITQRLRQISGEPNCNLPLRCGGSPNYLRRQRIYSPRNADDPGGAEGNRASDHGAQIARVTNPVRNENERGACGFGHIRECEYADYTLGSIGVRNARKKPVRNDDQVVSGRKVIFRVGFGND